LLYNVYKPWPPSQSDTDKHAYTSIQKNNKNDGNIRRALWACGDGGVGCKGHFLALFALILGLTF